MLTNKFDEICSRPLTTAPRRHGIYYSAEGEIVKKGLITFPADDENNYAIEENGGESKDNFTYDKEAKKNACDLEAIKLIQNVGDALSTKHCLNEVSEFVYAEKGEVINDSADEWVKEYDEDELAEEVVIVVI